MKTWRVKYRRHDPVLKMPAVGIRYVACESKEEAQENVTRDVMATYGVMPEILETSETIS